MDPGIRSLSARSTLERGAASERWSERNLHLGSVIHCDGMVGTLRCRTYLKGHHRRMSLFMCPNQGSQSHCWTRCYAPPRRDSRSVSIIEVLVYLRFSGTRVLREDSRVETSLRGFRVAARYSRECTADAMDSIQVFREAPHSRTCNRDSGISLQLTHRSLPPQLPLEVECHHSTKAQ